MISNFWTDTTRYYEVRRRLPKDTEPELPAAPESKPLLSDQLRQWAQAHDGQINVKDAADAFNLIPDRLRRRLNEMHAKRIDVGVYALPDVPLVVKEKPNHRRALIDWAEAHGGLVNVDEVAAALDALDSTVQNALARVGAQWVARRTYRVPLQDAPRRPVGRLMQALIDWSERYGEIDAHQAADALMVQRGAIRGAIQRLGGQLTERPHTYRLPKESSS